MEYICMVIILLLISIFLIGSCKGFYINKDNFSKLWAIVLVTSFIMAFIFEQNPAMNLDLLRIYARLSDIRNYGLDNALKYIDLEKLYFFKYWMYIVSLTPFDNLLNSIPFFVEVYIFGVIIKDLLSKYGPHKMAYITLALFVWISLMGIKLAITDIRCVFAMTICCYALYLEFVKKQKVFFAISLYLIAIFTHHYTMIFMITRCFIFFTMRIKTKKLLFIFVAFLLLGPLLVDFITSNMGIYEIYFSVITQKLAGSYNRSYFIYREMSQKVLYIFMIIVVMSSAFYSYLNILSCKSENDNNSMFYRISISLFIISLFLLGFFNNYLIIERGIYIIAILFPIMYLLMPGELHAKNNPCFLIPLLIYILFINDINPLIVNKLGYSYLQF